MLLKFTQIALFGLTSFLVSFILYPWFIKLLKKYKGGQQIRDAAWSGGEASVFKELHAHKAGTPTMGGGMFLFVMALMVIISIILQQAGYINNSLFNRSETYVLLFAFFSMGFLGLVDDILNVRGKGDIKGLTSNIKFIRMFLFSGFISWWFYSKLGIDFLNLWPIAGEVQLGIFVPIVTFVFTVGLVNAVNVADGLDGLVGGLMLIILGVLAVMAFVSQRYLGATILVILIGSIIAFLRYNINPAKIFMGDAGALGLGGITATMVYLLNINTGIIIPFIILFALFWIEIGSSMLQLFWKKVFKKKLFLIAPFHHHLERKGLQEHSIVMRFWLIQGILGVLALAMLFYQLAA